MPLLYKHPLDCPLSHGPMAMTPTCRQIYSPRSAAPFSFAMMDQCVKSTFPMAGLLTLRAVHITHSPIPLFLRCTRFSLFPFLLFLFSFFFPSLLFFVLSNPSLTHTLKPDLALPVVRQ